MISRYIGSYKSVNFFQFLTHCIAVILKYGPIVFIQRPERCTSRRVLQLRIWTLRYIFSTAPWALKFSADSVSRYESPWKKWGKMRDSGFLKKSTWLLLLGGEASMMVINRPYISYVGIGEDLNHLNHFGAHLRGGFKISIFP